MSPLLVLKLLLVPLFIGLYSLAGRRWGPTIAGRLAGLPVVTGPILFFLWLEQGAGFARGAAVYSLAAVAPVMAFAGVYAWASRRWGWSVTAAFAYGAWLLAAVAIVMLPIGAIGATLLAVGALIVAPRVFPQLTSTPIMEPALRFDLALRMLAGLVLTLLVTSIANVAGARVAGVLSLFPVISGVLAVFIHRSGGSAATVAALRGLARGFWSLAAFCGSLVVNPATSTVSAFGVATAVAIGVQALTSRR